MNIEQSCASAPTLLANGRDPDRYVLTLPPLTLKWRTLGRLGLAVLSLVSVFLHSPHEASSDPFYFQPEVSPGFIPLAFDFSASFAFATPAARAGGCISVDYVID
jgi:hypothetical protein